MPNVALIPGSGTVISALVDVVDGYPELVHRLETTTGGEPLESGLRVTDHAVARQEQLTLTGWVSDFNGGNRARDAWEKLRELHKKVKTVRVVTEWGVYPEMLIRKAEAPQTARGMRFTLELEEVIRVGVLDTELVAEELAGGPGEGRSGEIERGRVALGLRHRGAGPSMAPPGWTTGGLSWGETRTP